MVLVRASISAAALLVALDVAAQPLAFARADYASAPGPRAVVAADFNRDGAVDLALANTGRATVAILLNLTGSGLGFTPTHELFVGGGPFELAAGDLNRDNVLDLVVANAGLNTIDILLGEAGGGFRPPYQSAATGNPRGIALADMDWDGSLDIVYTQFDANSVEVLHGDGSGWNFTARQPAISVGIRPQGVAVGDFNFDGSPDLAIANSGVSQLTVLYQTPNDNFRRVDVAGPQSFNVLTTGDFNQDGWTDIAAASTGNNRVGVYLGSSDGPGYGTGASVGPSPRGIDAADVNHDGRLDLVTANRGGSTVSILRGRGNGGFDRAVTIAAGAGSRDVALADFNFDGQIDIATANEHAGTATVLSNRTRPPASLFWEARALSSSNTFGGEYVALADFNKNGLVDVVSRGGVTLDGTTHLPLAGGDEGSRYAFDAETGDFNNDGNVDVVLLTRHYEPWRVTVDLYHGDGAGAFVNVGSFGDFRFPYAVAAGDVNGDGKLDAVVVDGEGGSGKAHVMHGGGAGLVPAVTVDLPSISGFVQLKDVDLDGTLDLVTSHSRPRPGVNVAYNNGAGHFLTTAFLAAAEDRRSALVDDVNHDGYVDVVGGGSTALIVWLGRATGGFAPPAHYAVSSEWLTLADLNGDGHLDVFTGNSGVMRGRGDGTFADAERANAEWFDARPVDFDRDGRMDVVVGTWAHTMVLLSRPARGENHAPVADAGAAVTVRYEWQYEQDNRVGSGRSYDPDLDPLSYEWRDELDRIVSTEPAFDWPTRNPGSYFYTLTVRDGHGGEATDTLTVTVAPFKEAVVLAAEQSDFHGGWQSVPDPTAAGRVRAWHPNAAAAGLPAPLTTPVHYYDVYVLADPTQYYKLWVRLKAEHDSPANDSVFVQFDDGVVAPNGRTRFQIGTPDGLEVNLERCAGCGIEGWGWRDERSDESLKERPALLRFARGGWHRLRIQTREDGVSIDQIVLSSDRYLTDPPGPAKNDTTLLSPRP
jgi:hypothetical protein